MNRLIQQLNQDQHLSFNQKCRSIIMQIFGHEALFNVDDLGNISHCTVFNVDVQHLKKIRLKHLAYRKLLNPFKWIEIALVLPFELVPWCFQHSPIWLSINGDKIDKKCPKSITLLLIAYLFLSYFILAPITHLASNLALAIPRRILAPVRYLIRPTIDLIQTHPKTFALIAGCTLLIAATIAISIFTGGIPLAIGGLTLAGVVLAKTGIVVAAAATSWALFLKLATVGREMIDAIQRIKSAPLDSKQKIVPFQSASTEVITETLHAVNPKQTRVNHSQEQGAKQTLALMTGTESIFYKPRSTSKPHLDLKSPARRCGYFC